MSEMGTSRETGILESIRALDMRAAFAARLLGGVAPLGVSMRWASAQDLALTAEVEPLQAAEITDSGVLLDFPTAAAPPNLQAPTYRKPGRYAKAAPLLEQALALRRFGGPDAKTSARPSRYGGCHWEGLGASALVCHRAQDSLEPFRQRDRTAAGLALPVPLSGP